VVRALIREDGNRDELKSILEGAKDFRLAESAGLRIEANTDPHGVGFLTGREREVIDLVSQGLTNRAIGQVLFITEATVKVHLRHICRKLGVRSRTEAAVRFSELGNSP
jgi:DNA-binding NarL/FixJ family response regulator